MYIPLGCWLTDQAGARPGGQAGLRPVAIWRTLIGSHTPSSDTHDRRDVVLWQNG